MDEAEEEGEGHVTREKLSEFRCLFTEDDALRALPLPRGRRLGVRADAPDGDRPRHQGRVIR